MRPDLGDPGYFDRVVIEDGVRRELTAEEFLDMPLSQRIRCLIQRVATFYVGNREVERTAALDALRRARIAS